MLRLVTKRSILRFWSFWTKRDLLEGFDQSFSRKCESNWLKWAIFLRFPSNVAVKKATWRGEIGEQFPLIKQFSPELPVNLSFVSIQSFLYEGKFFEDFPALFYSNCELCRFLAKDSNWKTKRFPICDNQIMTERTKDMCQEWKRLLFRFDWVSEENEKLMDRRSQKISRSTPQVLCNFWSSILNKRGIDSYGFWVEIKWE